MFSLGVDSGSVAVSFVLLSETFELLKVGYEFHHGNPRQHIINLLSQRDLPGKAALVCTESVPAILYKGQRLDTNLAAIGGALHLVPDLRSILLVGGERFALIRFAEDGSYRDMKTNTSCAAGTGSFLDQQARRLSLSGVEQLAEMALSNRGPVPRIASRCSVFAKTDIIHAQQEGFSLTEICDGLCFGLAKNVADTLVSESGVEFPVYFCGGVSKNRAVLRHLEDCLNTTLASHPFSHVTAAYGAAVRGVAQADTTDPVPIVPLEDLFLTEIPKAKYYYEPLSLLDKSYPQFSDEQIFVPSSGQTQSRQVEHEVYGPQEPGILEVYLGIDVGSTSTKAMLIDLKRQPIAGFYTKTAGNPYQAVRDIFENIQWLSIDRGWSLEVCGAGTTGSGRKFIGKLLNVDGIIDEISAHAKAAYELDNKTDTIIEIGGQDSKFTTMRDGIVTFSKMNTVCAAGTGSFLEEQAARLEVPIGDFARRAMDQKAPLTSDRCTVFMERDINNLLHEGYEPDELLAASSFAVCENYLLKVASTGKIGSSVTFQGATAKNRALVAAFEKKLGMPIRVSRYCHLTGAMGAALLLIDEGITDSTFRGFSMWKEELRSKQEVCSFCRNNCRIVLATLAGETVAYGFLCGRDYETKSYVPRAGAGFDLLSHRKKLQNGINSATGGIHSSPSIGIPKALHLHETMPFWSHFFHSLGLPVVVEEPTQRALGTGKQIQGAEFCAPVAAFHGLCVKLAERVDFLFIPTYLSEAHGESDKDNRFCYYTQYAPALIANLKEGPSIPVISPVINPAKGEKTIIARLHKSLQILGISSMSARAVEKAYHSAGDVYREYHTLLQNRFVQDQSGSDGFDVVLLGRPYTILSDFMNKNIPGLFSSLGIKSWFQDMIPSKKGETADENRYWFHWYYTRTIFKVAQQIAKNPRLYPVLVTSFKCSPDSFLIEYLCEIFDKADKPYLILQLDEHASNVGYETRIEAAVRSFSNHFQHLQKPQGNFTVPSIITEIRHKTVLFPRWDTVTSPFLAANLRRAGYDVRLLEEDETLISESQRRNTGQCIPVQIIAHEFVHYAKKYHLDPARTALWIIDSEWSCNIRLYPAFLKTTIGKYGEGFEKSEVYAGSMIYEDLPLSVTYHAYLASLIGGLLRKLQCITRPYEIVDGETDRALLKSQALLIEAFSGNGSVGTTLERVVDMFEQIKRSVHKRPKVAIFGDLYVRDNDVFNQDLIRCIERAGGEAVTTSYIEYIKIVSPAYFRTMRQNRDYLRFAKYKTLRAALELVETYYRRYFPREVRGIKIQETEDVERDLALFGCSIEHDGESYDNILKVLHLNRIHPDLSLYVQTSPAFCCPSLVTEAMRETVEGITGVPVVTITYDGTGTPRNDVLVPYLQRNLSAAR